MIYRDITCKNFIKQVFYSEVLVKRGRLKSIRFRHFERSETKSRAAKQQRIPLKTDK